MTQPTDREKLEYFIEKFSEGFEKSSKTVRVGDRVLSFNAQGEVSKITFLNSEGKALGVVYP